MDFNEGMLAKTTKMCLKIARAGDWEHALRVVKFVKKLGKGRADLYLLITAAYLHDIGWSGVAQRNKQDLKTTLKLEKKANKNSFKLVTKILKKLKFTLSEIKTINRLVASADQHRSFTEDEMILVDADNLSKLCFEHLSQKYQVSSFIKLLNLWETELPKRIKTKVGKELYPKLLGKLKKGILCKSLFKKPF